MVSKTGELILLDAKANDYTEFSRIAALGKDEKGVYAHPAFVDTRIDLRGSSSLVCFALGP